MKVILTKETVRIPQDVTVTVEHKTVTVTGQYGTAQRKFPMPQLELELLTDTIEVRCWLGDAKARALVGTVCGHICNLINGVAGGYRLTTVSVYKHFPINQQLATDGRSVVLRNVMNTRRTRKVDMQGDLTRYTQDSQKRDTCYVTGTNLEDVTQSAAALIRESKDDMKRDPVKFVDGIYRKDLEYMKEDYQPTIRERNRFWKNKV